MLTPRQSYGSINQSTKQKKRKCKYRVRWFYSKGAFLVLVWTLLVNFTICSLALIYFFSEITKIHPSLRIVVPGVSFLLSAPLSGFLADAKFGNFRVNRAGFVLLFFGAVASCLYTLLLPLENETVKVVLYCVVSVLSGAGYGICIVTALQLGLDQMPDASSTNITSFIAWFACSFFGGLWVSGMLYDTRNCCVENWKSNIVQVWSLLLVLCMSIVLCSDFLLSPKWLTIEPKSPQSLKTIFKVLKFAAKHKAPVQRSALTYWEEDIPSRIDLGKSRYGGPFTTEQVEDVKTILRLLVLNVSFWVVSSSLYVSSFGHHYLSAYIPGLSSCTSLVLVNFAYSTECYAVIGTVMYEFAVYTLIEHRLPSILRRIGIGSFLVFITHFVNLILVIIGYYCNNQKTTTEVIAKIAYSVVIGLSNQLLLSLSLQFVCAQSPYNMRGLFVGCFMFGYYISFMTSSTLHIIVRRFCTGHYCSLVYPSVAVLLSLVGFILHCILARWYKRRVRDEVYHPQRVIEEVYDRYLSAHP